MNYRLIKVYSAHIYVQVSRNLRAVGSSPGVGQLIDQSGDAAEGS